MRPFVPWRCRGLTLKMEAEMMQSVAPCVWVVDDDRAVLAAVSRVLRSVGYGVRTFASGEFFLAEREHDTASCVVLDLWMPGMNGLELQERLARTHIPASVVFITGHGDVPTSVRAMKAGAVDFLMKPFEAPQLIAAVEAAL